ncbi:VWA domain-containing protein, partial [Streptomyces rubiginosohelvolus]
MAIDYRKRLKVPASAVSLEKVAAQAPGLVSLYKTAAVSLAKHDAGGQRAAVYLVLDRSGSMRRYYRNGSVQHLAEQTLALAANLDDDGVVPVVFTHSGDVIDPGLDTLLPGIRISPMGAAMTTSSDGQPLIPQPPATVTALRQAVAQITPAALPAFT